MGTCQDKDICETFSTDGGGSSIGGRRGGGGCRGSTIGGGDGFSDMKSDSGHGGNEPTGSISAWPPMTMPLRGLRENSTPPPFLINLYKIVDDNETDSIISWGSTGTSFIIRDEKRLITEVLCRHSKSIRFNTFLTQLNSYGFKKIKWNPNEYANEWFQEGKKHLLMNIKRRNQVPKVTTSQGSDLQAMFGELITGQEEMKLELRELKEHLEGTFSNLQKIIVDTTYKLMPTFANGECYTTKKRKFDDSGVSYGEVEREFQSIFEKSELLENIIAENDVEGEQGKKESKNFMALWDLMENPADRSTSYSGYIETRKSKQCTAFSDKESNSENASGSGIGIIRTGRGCGRGGISPFLHKLYNMVEKQETDSLISWKLPNRTSFIIRDHNKFATDVLPLYFNHCNFSSFNSQLNIYGFKKLSWECHEYANEWFMGGRIDLLANIKRRDEIKQVMFSTATCSSPEVEKLKNCLKDRQQKQEEKKIQLSMSMDQMKSSLSAFEEMVFSVANIVKKMTLESNLDHAEHVDPKKTKLDPHQIIENNEIGIEKVEVLAAEEPRDDRNVWEDKENEELQACFQDIRWMNKMMEMEYDNRMVQDEVQREMASYLSRCIGEATEFDAVSDLSLAYD